MTWDFYSFPLIEFCGRNCRGRRAVCGPSPNMQKAAHILLIYQPHPHSRFMVEYITLSHIMISIFWKNLNPHTLCAFRLKCTLLYYLVKMRKFICISIFLCQIILNDSETLFYLCHMWACGFFGSGRVYLPLGGN